MRDTHVYEVRPRKDHRGVNLISDSLRMQDLFILDRSLAATKSTVGLPRVRISSHRTDDSLWTRRARAPKFALLFFLSYTSTLFACCDQPIESNRDNSFISAGARAYLSSLALLFSKQHRCAGSRSNRWPAIICHPAIKTHVPQRFLHAARGIFAQKKRTKD
jgi:hypothetical protein